GSTENECKLGEKVVEHVRSIEKVRFCNAGTDATYHAIRLARAYTGRKKIMKFEGAYHGWHDYVDFAVAPPAEKVGTKHPVSTGILPEAVEKTVVVPWNDASSFEKAARENGEDLAAVIVEPILHNVGCIMPKEGFLQTVREVTEEVNAVLIFDEVITGFRHGLGGAQEIFGVYPDLTCFAKSLANGYAIGGVGGIEEIMDQLKPIGGAHMAGTYCANPISVAAALATLGELEGGAVHERLFKLGDMARKGLAEVLGDLKIKAQVSGFRSIFNIYFTDEEIVDYRSLLGNDSESFLKYNRGMRERGFLFVAHPLKRCHLSDAHTEEDVRRFIEASRDVLSKIKRQVEG
ncbi:MAG: aminotransferase class III-fold pyridoxal phosphate-dependent enzyme, partial [Candidatus Brockarchaeota archaeon]|nr:aminotransferase class III-fold pyridoxal phosphate-dependent enzyme [Candidatus Brockarchaeota archaeon]